MRNYAPAMSLQDSDISWQMLRRIVHDWLGTSAELDEVKRLDGGSVNTTLALHTKSGERAVLKVCPHRINRHYPTEAYQLNILRAIGLPTPQVYTSQTGDLDNPVSYLLIEYLDGVDLNTARQQCTPEQFDHLQQHLADLIVTMHNNTHDAYTRVTDGNREEFPTWPAFYRHVYDPHFHECEKNPALPVKARKTIAKVHERLDRLLIHDD